MCIRDSSFIGFHDDEFVLGPWLLGGLVPMFVGVAQIVNALINGARFGATRAGTLAPPSPIDSGQRYDEPQESESQKRPPV